LQESTKTTPTPYPDLNVVLEHLIQSSSGILDGNFHAACLQGSFALGGFDRDSDVDFLIVVHDDLSGTELEALQAMHAHIFSSPCVWAQHLEGSYIRKDVLRDYTLTGCDLWFLDHGSQSLVRSRHCNSAVVRCTVREYGIRLAGPDPRSLVELVPLDVLRNEVFTTITEWGGHSLLTGPQQINSLWHQAFVVVSYCRMLHTLRTGQLGSKLASVRWAMSQLDARWAGLIARAWAQRPNPALKSRQPVDTEELASTIDFVRYAIDLASDCKARGALDR
jgi:hypothetical protein